MTKFLTLEDGKQKMVEIDFPKMLIVTCDSNLCTIEADNLLGCDLSYLGGVEDC